MAENTLGRNIQLPIYNEDGTPFEGLVLHKFTVDSVVMSLGDKITGEVYYKDNALTVTMKEYVEYNGIQYTLVNPPTIVREGMVSNNSDLKGMTKYSFEFYHPMYQLSNMPFSDVAVSSDESMYLSQNKTFSWIGKPNDYIAKLNKNLQGTQWIVVKSDRFPAAKDNELSDVIQFDKNTIADALKTFYETWGVPYIIDKIDEGEAHYSEGKRFLVVFGLPSNEIIIDGEPFVFRFGQGVGLKNNSRTPRNNKIITRISGYGSSDNIPYGYPQIRWYGDPTATETQAGYPIYEGIVGGAKVKLIHHPFTRTELMPSVYSESVFNKVSPYLEGGATNPNYNPNADIIDYYDAIATQEYPYINEINPQAPSYEIHEFSEIKPELKDGEPETILDAYPINDSDRQRADKWDDSIDEDGNYVQGYFKVVLPTLTFDLYACAAITQEMQISMRSGACIGCTFPVEVDWDDYRANFYDQDGNFDPVIGEGHPRDAEKYPDSSQTSIELILQKEYATFGTIMPNVYQQPKNGDEFVILGISLPLSYITNAEHRLDVAMKTYMLENNIYYYDYPLTFDEYFFATHTNVLSQVKPNTVVRFEFGGDTEHPLQLFVKQLTIKYGDDVLPKYDITLTDNVEVVLNQIGQVADDVEKLSTIISALRQNYGKNVWNELAKKLSKTDDDVAMGNISFAKNAKSRDFVSGILGGKGWQIDNLGNGEFESLRIRTSLEVPELLINRQQAQEGDTIFSDNDQIEAIEKRIDDTDPLNPVTYYTLSFKEKWDGYITAQQYGNIIKGIVNTLAAREAGVSDVDPQAEGTESDGKNSFYTSWMRVVATHDEDNTLGVNQVRVVLYGDQDVPAQKNFEPCIMMNCARWGCVDYADPESADYEAVLASIKKRQVLILISTSDGRIIKMTGVNKPILERWNYGTTLGTLPEFVHNWPSVERELVDGRDYLYAQGIVVGQLIKVDIEGKPEVVIVDCEEWIDGNTAANPTPQKGIYYYDTYNETTQQYETHDVWHNGLRWRCVMNQPVVVGGVSHYYEPKWNNAAYWKMIGGNDNLSMEFSSSMGYRFRRGYVNTVITPYVYYGNIDISADISDGFWTWTRYEEKNAGKQGDEKYTEADKAWNLQHKYMRRLTLTNNDMPIDWSSSNRIIFECTCVVDDGKSQYIVDNQIIA